MISIHFLYVNWIPTHHPLTQREFKEASRHFLSRGKEKVISEFTSDFYLKEDLKNIKNYVSFELNIPKNSVAVLHNSGLLFIEVKDYKLGREDFKDFCAGEYYEPLKMGLHTHMFIHKLSGNFPFCESHEGEGLEKILQTLYENYLDELKSQIDTAKIVHDIYINDLSLELEE